MNRLPHYNRLLVTAKYSIFRADNSRIELFEAVENASKAMTKFGIAAARMMHMLSRQPLTEEIKRKIRLEV